ncbi:MAG: hypothetical protein IJA54_00690 [Tyzzerella sp.]|nr:hypothetical protein [Tyzzerella sp.]
MCAVSFKERVRNEAIANAKFYQANFVDYEYLICSEAFENGFHIIKADKGNYLHLIGIHTELSAEQFFDKCFSEELEEADFDFLKPGKSEKSVKGSVREKITVLPEMVNLFTHKLLAEDNFKKNRVECAFTTSDNTCTLGFAVSGRPKSLLKGNKLEKSKVKDVDVIFRRPRGSEELFEELVWGKRENVHKYKGEIEQLVSKEYLEKAVEGNQDIVDTILN